MAFEVAVLEALPFCAIHIFDKDNYGVEQWFPDPQARKQVSFHRAFIAAHDDLQADPPRRSLKGIMAQLGHTHIDILKVDIEGNEFGTFDTTKLPSVGQLLIEVRLDLASTKSAATASTLGRSRPPVRCNRSSGAAQAHP
eukprot:6536460-Prymnesium_polylepis.1